ncbi:hypothetical protein M9H77_03469 [Catharanthus roseus]|uniref:Uncharacterized protein n=1 Tax=Catharanthus roseus TaxID=4058 RepID=A0ACC0CBT8_CATRO|nr:hypothetical protein M9H77_03469 [Catharanthus roseus]
MHKRSLKGNLQRSKRSLKTTKVHEDEVIKLNTLKTRRLVRSILKVPFIMRNDLLFPKRMEESRRNKELKNKIDILLNDNSKLICKNKTLLESLEVLKKEKEFSNLEFQKLILENKNLFEKVLSLEECMEDYNDLKKNVSDLTICIEKFTKEKEIFEELLGSQRSAFGKKGIG